MKRSIQSTRALQIAFFVLLVICVGQVAYWWIDQVRFSAQVQERLLEHYEDNVKSASLMLEAGVSPEGIVAGCPHLTVTETGEVVVRPEVREALEDERFHRVHRYTWEGGFFLLVLVAGIGVIGQVLRQRADLHRRHHNFLAAVTHEFKSPLASLRLSAETLMMRKPDDETRTRLANRMVSDVTRLEGMVVNVLDAARIDAGGAVGSPERIELGPELLRVIEIEGALAQGRGVELCAEAAPEAVVEADRAALRIVLDNLVHNAVKSVAGAGGGTVELRATRDDALYRVDVIDDGLGFDPAEASKLFDEFYRPGDELRRRTKGTGLGLYIVKNLVELGGGRVAAESEGPGRGARMSVWWPAGPDEEEAS